LRHWAMSWMAAVTSSRDVAPFGRPRAASAVGGEQDAFELGAFGVVHPCPATGEDVGGADAGEVDGAGLDPLGLAVDVVAAGGIVDA
jgi:hypothetical protein